MLVQIIANNWKVTLQKSKTLDIWFLSVFNTLNKSIFALQGSLDDLQKDFDSMNCEKDIAEFEANYWKSIHPIKEAATLSEGKVQL